MAPVSADFPSDLLFDPEDTGTSLNDKAARPRKALSSTVTSLFNETVCVLMIHDVNDNVLS
jgi:hypothetical protein